MSGPGAKPGLSPKGFGPKAPEGAAYISSVRNTGRQHPEIDALTRCSIETSRNVEVIKNMVCGCILAIYNFTRLSRLLYFGPVGANFWRSNTARRIDANESVYQNAN